MAGAEGAAAQPTMLRLPHTARGVFAKFMRNSCARSMGICPAARDSQINRAVPDRDFTMNDVLDVKAVSVNEFRKLM